MAFTLRGITEGLFKNGYAWMGHPSKDKALNWAKTCAVQPQGTTTSAADSLAIPVTHSNVQKTTGADAEALTIVDGTPGQILTITLDTDGGGNGTLTGDTNSTASGWSTILFADAGDTATLMYVDDTVGWIILGCYGLTAQPTVAAPA